MLIVFFQIDLVVFWEVRKLVATLSEFLSPPKVDTEPEICVFNEFNCSQLQSPEKGVWTTMKSRVFPLPIYAVVIWPKPLLPARSYRRHWLPTVLPLYGDNDQTIHDAGQVSQARSSRLLSAQVRCGPGVVRCQE